MHQKWKHIIANWINCYFYENNNKNEKLVKHESLVNIISHLRDNFNLDESKSSVFSGRSLEEFIAEKYPGFTFENGTVEVTNEEEIYIAASLLLFFVCVNSKDVDIKSAMCSKLSTGDQEVILRYSKTLMECHSISSHDVIAAIAEACGPDMATGEGACGQSMVAETPPALRSLHGEVRRLQATLDAERFDKNYLQDELARTNLKMEKLLKDQEQYKMDIMNLKAKISMCCGQDTETQRVEAKSSEIVKLSKQLQLMEQRVVDVQEQLEEVQHERDTYKTKLDDLKGECDRLLLLSQEEASQSRHLAEELETEKRQSQTLRELVIELRQHNHRNGLDSSLLECDDPDTSVQSLQRSFSVCSEVCANVVEVQLGEERAKCLALKQQIQSLQDEMKEQIQIAETLQKSVTDRENDILNLKHRINEEIEEKNNLKSYFDKEITKLNNLVNELEQKIKDNVKHSSSVIEKKMQDIQTLQEEKLSLLQSLSDETTKSENMIKNLKTEIDSEKLSKSKMRDDYENLVMKMKEKVLNRNNELVEQQNNILKKSELIEQLNLELRKERELKDETINKYNKDLELLHAQKSNVEKELQGKCKEVTELVKQIHQRDECIEEMVKDLEYFKMSTSTLKEDCRILEENKRSLLDDIQNRQISAEKLCIELDTLKQMHNEEKDMLQCKFEEMCAMVKSLQTQLQNEIDFKLGIQRELEKTQGVITKLSNTNTKLHAEQAEVMSKMLEKDEIIKTNNTTIHEKEELLAKLQQDYCLLKTDTERLSIELLHKVKLIEDYEDKLEHLNKSFEHEKSEYCKIIDTLNTELATVNKQKQTLADSSKSLSDENSLVIKKFNEKCDIITQMEIERENLSQKMEEKGAIIQTLEQKLNDKMVAFMEIENNFEHEISKLVSKLSDTEKTLKEVTIHSNKVIENQELQIQSLNAEIFKLKGIIETSFKEKAKLESEKACLENKIEETMVKINEIENDYKSKCDTLEGRLDDLKLEVIDRDKEISYLNAKNSLLFSSLSEKEKELSILQDENCEWKSIKDIMDETLKKEKQSMQESLFELNNNNSKLMEELKQNQQTIEILEEKLKTSNSSIASLEADKVSKQSLLDEKDREKSELDNKNKLLESERYKLTVQKEELESKIVSLHNELQELKNNLFTLTEENSKLLDTVEEKKIDIIELQNQIQLEHTEKLAVCHTLENEKLKHTSDYNILQEKYSLAADELEKQNKASAMYQEVIDKNNNVIKDLEKANSEKEKILDDLNKEREVLENEKYCLIQERNNSLMQINKLEEQIKVLVFVEIPRLKEDNIQLTNVIEENKNVIINLEKRIENEIERNNKLSQCSDSEKINLTNKCSLLQENLTKAERSLEQRNLEVNELKKEIDVFITKAKLCEEDLKLNNVNLIRINEEKDSKIQELTQELDEQRAAVLQNQKEIECKEITLSELKSRVSAIENVTKEMEVIKKDNEQIIERLRRKEQECALIQIENDEWKIKKDALEVELENEKKFLQQALKMQIENNQKLETDAQVQVQKALELREKLQAHDIMIGKLQSEKVTQEKLLKDLENKIALYEAQKDSLTKENSTLTNERNDTMTKLKKLQNELDFIKNEKVIQLTEENTRLSNTLEQNKSMIPTLEKLIKKELEQNELLRKENSAEKSELIQKCNILQENQRSVEQELNQGRAEIKALQDEILNIKSEAASREEDLKAQNIKLTNVIQEKEELLSKINDELSKEILLNGQYQKEAESREKHIRELQNILKEDKHAMVEVLMNENKKLIAQIESNAALNKETCSGECDGRAEKNQDDLHPQVDCISSTNVSYPTMDCNKTIRDLEKILNDKNRTITFLQVEITFLKSLMAESENKVLDLTKNLEVSQENCQQLSIDLKKILQQKNEEIADLKSKISKMTAMENRASQIIKVSAKYQEIIHKRMAEIKSNTVLKELTNFGNVANCDGDLKRGLNSGAVTMEDLESFLETTERHIRRCSEKRAALQKERDRLLEVNRINESEIISVRKFLAELSVSVRTFSSVKEVYAQQLSRVVSLQRTVRREILEAEERLTEAAACSLERGYAAAMQDLAECAMNVQRWADRCHGRALSAERIKQAFSGGQEHERGSLAAASFQNAGLEAQMEQLAGSFQKLLEEAARARSGNGARDALAMTVREVRAEYEEKLARMKTKMKELYQKEVQSFKEAQRDEIKVLHQELQSTKETLKQAHKYYEDEIRSLNLELWTLGEKFLGKNDEAEWLRRRQRSESLMSLQHVPTAAFAAQTEEPCKVADSHSLRSLPVNVNKKREGRGLHMSDEEGEVFDNRCLRELNTPRAPRLSELRWRNSLCPPHLKSSYPAETQFAPALREEDIKAGPTDASVGERQQRKEVGITAYKKPGPPTPSKQAGRLSATDSELRESLRVEAEPQPRKTATPSRLRLLFTSARNDTVEGTPRSRRLSNFFRKK